MTGQVRRLTLLGAAVIVLGAFGVWATVHAHSLRDSSAQDNVAVTDGAATAAVRGQITAAIDSVFSYRYNSTATTRRAAQRVLTGSAIRQYDTLFSLVERRAPAEKLVLTTRVVDSGVEFLTQSRARVLVFADQQDTVAGTQQSSYAGSMLAVTAVEQDGRWKISGIDTFGGGS